MNNRARRILTIGHSNHSIEALVALLQQNEITALADVRSAPFSRFNPQFNKTSLEQETELHGIKYVFLGRELGARPENSSLYENGQVQFERLKDTTLFREGIERVIQGAKQYNIALMCAEKDPLQCHRFLLVACELEELGMPVAHILATGEIETHEATLARLHDASDTRQNDLFDSKEDLILSLQKKRIAYVDKKHATGKEQGTA